VTIKRCATCGKARPMFRRGRCHRCYWEFRKTNPPLPPGGAYHVGTHTGSLRAIAAEVGVSHVTVAHALACGRLVQTEAGWVYTPGVSGRPRKAG
jgi:hypothetical protein